MDFVKFKAKVAKQFEMMKGSTLFRTDAPKDGMWETYLKAFPEGTNPLFREKTVYDCSCCRQFIKNVGNVVIVQDNKLVSIWDILIDEEPNFQIVADALSAYVKSFPIKNIFLSKESTAGKDKDFDQIAGNTVTFHHFFINIPKVLVHKTGMGTVLADKLADHDVLKRSLTDLTQDSVDTVAELIAQNSIYRGEEFEKDIANFSRMKKEFDTLSEEDKDNFVWAASVGSYKGVVRMRNTPIGTLLTDLSEGRDLEIAVNAFESIVAPENYKRSTALVTKAMVDNAKATLEKLGLTSALNRRFATIDDVHINNILFTDKTATVSKDVFEEIASDAPVKNLSKVEVVSIDKFLSDILPNATSIEALVENTHAGNFVSLIAPSDPTAGNLFKWNNKFSWSYVGEVADSIKERVKQMGGNVTGDLCCRLSWFNYDDLDLHMFEPKGYAIYFHNKRLLSPCKGMLDVDMNAGGRTSRTPVENIFYSNRATMDEGIYTLVVHNYSKRETVDVGFEVEIDYLGTVTHFSYNKAMRTGERVIVAKFKYTRAKGIEFIESLPSTQTSKTNWNVKTMTYTKVKAIMLSPNYWEDNAIGNKHYFFMLDDCISEGTVRGFYNEFLKGELNEHRKVFEIVGSKIKLEDSPHQLSGLGFSSTRRSSLKCRVNGKFSRVVEIQF